MGLTDSSLQQVTEIDLQELLTTKVPEGKGLDYKLTLPGVTDQDKREFLADFSSFANAAGGHLVYGIAESGGLPTAIPGLQSINADSAILRLESLAQTGLDPRVPGTAMRSVPLANGNVVIVTAIPRSTAGPHMVTAQGVLRFYSRNSGGKYLMSVAELQAAFGSSGLLAAVRLELEAVLAALMRRHQWRPDDDWIEARWGSALQQLPDPDRRALYEALAQTVSDMPLPKHLYLEDLVATVPLSDDPSASVSLDSQVQRMSLLSYVLAGTPQRRYLRMPALRQVAISGALLGYDPSSQMLQDTAVSNALAELIAEADMYESRYETVDSWRVQLISEISSAARRRAPFVLAMERAIPIWALHHTQGNIFHRAACLYAYLLGIKPSPEPEPDLLRPGTPLGSDMQARIEREQATREHVRQWNLAPGFWRIGAPHSEQGAT